MRIFAIFAALFVLWAEPCFAEDIPQASCNASYEALSAADKAHVAYDQFVRSCQTIRQQWLSPSPPRPNAGLAYITGLCGDNSYTTSLIRADACRQDGGVRAWFFGNYTPPQAAPQIVTPPEEHLPSRPGPAPQPPRQAPKPVPQRPAAPETPTTAVVS